MVISIFESAYMHYHIYSPLRKASHWPGWEKYIDDWLTRKSFKKYCKVIIKHEYYSKELTGYLAKRIKQIEE